MSEITNNETSGEGTLTNNVNDCGVDVSNCLSLFLCVANYEKLLPGWSHLAQFSVAVENKDPKKSKIADTLHQFWKKEHDWGWKKFIELPKLQDGFIDKFDSLSLKAQVQEGTSYGLFGKSGENVHELCGREKKQAYEGDRRQKEMEELMCLWLGMDHNARLEISSEKMDVILKQVVKHFFVKNEVTSTLLMDFLFYRLKSLEEKRRRLETLVRVVAKEVINSNQSESAMKNLEEETKKERTNDDKEFALKINEDETKNERTIDAMEFEASIAYVVNDMLGVTDPLLRLERFVLAPLPEMGSPKLLQVSNLRIQHNMEPDEKQLADYGRWALEVFVLDHIFCNKIEFTYEETIALKRQEELIHEEEAEKNTKLKKTFVGKKVN
ncbi:TRAF-like superfamily protein [Arabidopsis thaliana]|uniref:TRAF-like superfamily protein n=1 Tax=Arabidopsis thaliana TaxID=3702 RepID=F4JKZ7_ARATH|nr:TRAF-like superfamily protein [Arabidopsis thaliana]AEE83685.1 TRAF-like superfamily protein [Arabidopsis thaliana]|eukprot:NP_680705.1 TRAF-like superfamily protein [Arabidopsis thaliana]